jgi:propanediol dehydratase small subunit
VQPSRPRRRPTGLLPLCAVVLASCISVSVGAPAVPSPAASPASTASATATPSPTPGPDPEHCTTRLSDYALDVRATGDVTDEDIRLVTAAIHLAQGAYEVRVPECEPGDVEVAVLDRTNERFAAATLVTAAPHFRIEIYAGGSAWRRTPRSQIPIILLHEWYHVLQYSFLGCERCHVQVNDVPHWLIEGSAEYAAARAAQDQRILFYSFIRRYELFGAGQVDTRLERMGEAHTSADYGLAFAAVELLVSRSGPGSLLDFWEQAGATGRWEAAFPDAFGTTPAAFYREFAAYRAAGFRR